MTHSHPPRIALWLLERFGPDNEPLIGDLIEQFETRSRWWFWRQVLAALVLARFQRPRVIRPLRLVDREPEDVRFGPVRERRTINLTASPIHGVGGLGLLALALLISVATPQMWLIVIAVVLDGLLLGVVWALITRPRAHPGGAGILFHGSGEHPDSGREPKERA